VAKILPDDDELPELPGELGPDDELAGTADADDLVLADIGDGPEELGLDADAALDADSVDSALDAEEEDGVAWTLDDSPVEVDAELDLDGDEQGWTDDNEGSAEAWDDDLSLDEEETDLDDGGLEGVEDPLLDGLDDEGDSEALSEGDDEDEYPEDLGDDLVRGIFP
jgi:hypothetical protein